jgi:hypothetical protein
MLERQAPDDMWERSTITRRSRLYRLVRHFDGTAGKRREATDASLARVVKSTDGGWA